MKEHTLIKAKRKWVTRTEIINNEVLNLLKSNDYDLYLQLRQKAKIILGVEGKY